MRFVPVKSVHSAIFEADFQPVRRSPSSTREGSLADLKAEGVRRRLRSMPTASSASVGGTEIGGTVWPFMLGRDLVRKLVTVAASYVTV